MAPLRTYSGDDVSVVLGDKALSGLVSVTPSREADSFSDSVGMTGEVARTKTSDKRGNIVIVLQQTSPDNDFLSSLIAIDEATGNGTFSVLVRDQNGTSLFDAESAWIMKPADAAFAAESGEREWTVRCSSLSMNVGGNAPNE